MATQVQLRKGTTSEHAAFTGALGEVTVDTTAKSARVHDGSTAGGSLLVTVSALAIALAGIPTSSPFVFDITKAPYNAVGDGSTDDTAAIQAAWDDAKVAGGRLFVPPAKYAISTLDFTACVVGVEVVGVGPAGGTGSAMSVFKPIHQTTSKPGVDCTGSSYITFRNIQVYAFTTNQSTAPSVKPTCGWLIAASGEAFNSNKTVFEHCGTNGYFTTTALGLASTVNNTIIGGQFMNQEPGGSATYTGKAAGKTWNTVHPNGVDTTFNFANENVFISAELHNRYLDATGTAPTIELNNANTFEFYGQVVSNSGSGAYINVDGSCAGCKIRPSKFYSEYGGVGYVGPEYIIHAEATAAISNWDVFSYVNPGNGPSVAGFSGESGATVTNSFLGGFASSHYSGNLVASFVALDAGWNATSTVVTASSGTITTASGSTRSIKVGKTVHFHSTLTVTTNGTGSGALLFNLPYPAAVQAVFVGRERATSGSMVQGVATGGASTAVAVYTAANGYPVASGSVIEMSGTYETV